jgi:PDZ domain-containing protein
MWGPALCGRLIEPLRPKGDVMSSLVRVCTAVLILALVATGAAAQDCGGCGGDGAKARVEAVKTVIVEIEDDAAGAEPCKGSCGKAASSYDGRFELVGQEVIGKYVVEARAAKGPGGCDGDCAGKAAKSGCGDCAGKSGCSGKAAKSGCGGGCASKAPKAGKCGCGGKAAKSGCGGGCAKKAPKAGKCGCGGKAAKSGCGGGCATKAPKAGKCGCGGKAAKSGCGGGCAKKAHKAGKCGCGGKAAKSGCGGGCATKAPKAGKCGCGGKAAKSGYRMAEVGGSCGSIAIDSKSGCAGSGTCTIKATKVEAYSPEAMVAELTAHSKDLTKELRKLHAAGRIDEARKLAVALKSLNGNIARIKARSKPAHLESLKAMSVLKPAEIRWQGGPGFLGIHMADEKGTGVRVVQTVDKSPAARYLKAGDLIISVNGKPAKSTAQLGAILSGMKAGSPVKINVTRDGRQCMFMVRLAPRPGTPAPTTAPAVRILEKAAVGKPVKVLERRTAYVRAQRLESARPISRVAAGRAVSRPAPVRRKAGKLAGEIERFEKSLHQLHAMLPALKEKAQKALAANQFEVAAKASADAAGVMKRLEMGKQKLVEMKKQQAKARSQAKPAVGYAFGAASPSSRHIAALEKRLGALEKRLARMEQLLKRIAGASRK